MEGSALSLPPLFCSLALPTSRQVAQADLEHVSPSRHTQASTQKVLGAHMPGPSSSHSQDPSPRQQRSVMAMSEGLGVKLAPMGGGGEEMPKW